MSKKGGSTNVIQTPAPTSMVSEREQSPDELRLLQTQNAALESGIAIAQEQEARARQTQDIWMETYLPIETGMISKNATRETGYQDMDRLNKALDTNNYRSQPSSGSSSQAGGQGMANSIDTATGAMKDSALTDAGNSNTINGNSWLVNRYANEDTLGPIGTNEGRGKGA